MKDFADPSFMDGSLLLLPHPPSSLLVPLHFHRNHHAVRLSLLFTVGSAQFVLRVFS